jgi:hypothetical protein
MGDLIGHLESYLGPMSGGWSNNADGDNMPFQIAKFRSDGRCFFTTLGLAHIHLHSAESGKGIHHELLVIVDESQEALFFPSILEQLAIMSIDSGHAFLRGQVVGPAGPIVPGSVMEAFYVAMPVYLPDSFATYSSGEGDVVIAWLVPTSAAEAASVREAGWNAFEDRLVTDNPALDDLYRASLLV